MESHTIYLKGNLLQDALYTRPEIRDWGGRPRNADLLLLITVWNEAAEKIDRIQHQYLVSGLKIYRGRILFGKPQPPLWSGVESARTGRSAEGVFERFRNDIDDLMKQSPEKETASPAQLPPKTDP